MINADSEVMYRDTIAAGSHWSMLVRRGMILRLIDSVGGANVGMLMYNPMNKLERYNAPDTLKCQHTFKLTQGHCLYSDMGRIFCSVVSDTVGWHDTIGGYLTDSAMAKKYPLASYQEARNEWTLSGEHSFMVELAKYELGVRDLSANVNWFSKVAADEDGQLSYQEGNSQAGDYVDLRFEMDTLVVLSTCPHPMHIGDKYPRSPINYELRKAPMINEDDECANACTENKRGFKNNALYHLGASDAR